MITEEEAPLPSIDLNFITPKLNEEKPFSKLFVIKSNEGTDFVLLVEYTSLIIKFKAHKQNSINFNSYQNNFDYSSLLKKLCLVKEKYENIENFMKFLEKAIEKKMLNLIVEKEEKKIILRVKRIVDFDEEISDIVLNEIKADKTEIIDELINEIKSIKENQKIDIQKKNEEIKHLKEEIKKVNEEKNEEIKNIKDEIQTLKEQINKVNSVKEKLERKIEEDEINNSDFKEKKELKKFLFNNENIKFNLLYKATVNGDKIEQMFRKIKGYSPTLFVIFCENGMICGGYTEAFWEMDNNYKSDQNAFLYNFNDKKIFKIKVPGKAIIMEKNHFACFGQKSNSDFYIRNNFLSLKIFEKNIKISYPSNDYDLTGKNNSSVEELLVFHVIIP